MRRKHTQDIFMLYAVLVRFRKIFLEKFALFWHEEQLPVDFIERIKRQQLLGDLYEKFLQRNKPIYASFDDFIDDAIKE